MGRVAGIEPTSQDSESCALSFELHAQTGTALRTPIGIFDVRTIGLCAFELERQNFCVGISSFCGTPWILNLSWAKDKVRRAKSTKWRAYSESNRDSWFRGPAPFALDDKLKLVGSVSTRTDISQLKGLVFYH